MDSVVFGTMSCLVLVRDGQGILSVDAAVLSLSGVSFDGQVRCLLCVLLRTGRSWCGDWFKQEMFYKAAGHIHSYIWTIHLRVGRVATALSSSALTPTSGKYRTIGRRDLD